MSAAVGAFLVGIALSGEVAHGARNLLSPLRDLFAAVFFVFFGLSTDPAKIPPVLAIALGLAVLTGLTKIATGWYAARRAGIGTAGRWRAGGTLVARGEFSIVIAGLAVGVEPKLGPLATAYVLILVILGPVAARYTEPIARRLTRKDAKPATGRRSPAPPRAPRQPAPTPPSLTPPEALGACGWVQRGVGAVVAGASVTVRAMRRLGFPGVWRG